MMWCEDQENVDFVLVLAKNERLIRRIRQPLRQAKRTYQQDRPSGAGLQGLQLPDA